MVMNKTAYKGDVLEVARVAGIMAKHTSELIPMCHPLALTGMASPTHFCRKRLLLKLKQSSKLPQKPALRWRR